MSTRFGRYDLLRPLGKGGMAEVFVARYLGPQGFEKELVIKRVLRRLADDRQLLRLFFEEAKTQVSFSHGNLVSVSDFGRVGNDYFIAMEHVRGADLASLLAAERTADTLLPPALVAYLGIELCRGLAYVHRRGFVHRDLSPRNVLLSIDGEVKLSDFGLALAVAMETDTVAGLRGTIGYVSPEQARGERVSARSDLYSLGLLLAEAVLGYGLRGTVNSKDPAVIAAATQAVPAEAPLAPVLARAIAEEPSRRFASADEMSAALEQALGALGVSRESQVRLLASKIEPLAARSDAPAPVAERVSAVGTQADSVPSAAASYYRDQKSATFIEEVLAAPAMAPARAGRGWLIAAGLLLLAGGTIAAIALRPPGAPVVAPGVAAPGPAPAVGESAPVPEVPPATRGGPLPDVGSNAIAPMPRAGARRPLPAGAGRVATPGVGATAATGTVSVDCTPWCVPFVDGQPAGQDGRRFTLTLPAGPHQIEVRRLDDRQQRQIDVRPTERGALTFIFD